MKVKAGSTYVFHPTGYDVFLTQHYDAVDGQLVKVVKLPGAPPPNTMGQAHVADAKTGEFLGMVSTASLSKA
jgi:hypothetical protein